MQKIKIKIFLIFLTLSLIFTSGCIKKIEKSFDSGCQQNLKETAVSIMIYKEKKGEYPNSLEELARQLNFDESFIHCPAKGGKTKFTYHKPPKKPSPEFIILECPNHRKEFKYRIKNLGSFDEL